MRVNCVLKNTLILIFLFLAVAGCSKAMVDARVVKDIKYVSETFAVDKEDVFKAAKWALVINKYPLATRDEKEGLLETAWVPTTTDSHAIYLFNRADLGVNGAYFQLIVKVVPVKDKIRVDVATRIKSVVSGVKSTGIAEKTILRDMRKYLRVKEPEVTNLGLGE